MRQFAAQFGRFAVVGFSSTAVDFVVFNVAFLFAKTLLGVDAESLALFVVCTTLAFIVATCNSYYWNRRWTFRAHDQSVRKTITRFYLVTITSFVVNVSVSSFLVWLDPLPAIPHTAWVNVAKLVAVGVSLCTNFLGYRFVAFRG